MAFDSFIQSSAFQLQQQYPQWRENGSGKRPICIPAASDVSYEKWKAKVCADLPSDQQAKKVLEDFQNKRKSKLAEQKLHEKLQSSDIGGIVIQDVSMEAIRKRLRKLRNDKSVKGFQTAFLLLHPNFGIIDFECKAREVPNNVDTEYFTKNFKQTIKHTEQLQALLQTSTGNQLNDIPVRNVLCYINGEDPELNSALFPKEFRHVITLFKDSFSDQTVFNTTLRKKLDIQGNTSERNLFADDNFGRFVAVLFGIRIAKFINLSTNAMEIHRMVSTQFVYEGPSLKKILKKNQNESVSEKPSQNLFVKEIQIEMLAATAAKHADNKISQIIANDQEAENNSDGEAASNLHNLILPYSDQEIPIFLNAEQQSAYKRYSKTDENLIILGPPGSGKTLLLLLMVQAAAIKEAPGRILLFVPSNGLAALYRNYLSKNVKQQHRSIIINPSKSDIGSDVEGDDDVFADEVFSGFWIPQNRGTSRGKGKMVIVVTVGRFYDAKSLQSVESVLKKRLSESIKPFNFIRLKIVTRCTRHIYDYCKEVEQNSVNDVDFPTISKFFDYCQKYQQIEMGHEIQGQSVEVKRSIPFQRAKELIKKRIEEWTRSAPEPLEAIYDLNEPSSSGNSLTDVKRKLGPLNYRHIAIIVAHEPVDSQVQEIKSYLKTNGIDCGSVEEQQNDEKSADGLVAVDSSINVLSLEWCAVVVLDASNCFYSKCLTNPIVPVSRAVSTLVVLETVQCGDSGWFFGSCPKRSSVVYDSLCSLLQKPSIRDSEQKRENFLIKAWQKIYQIASNIRIICFFVIFLATAIMSAYIDDTDVIFWSIMGILFVIHTCICIFMVVASCCSERLLTKHAIKVEIVKRSLVALAIVTGIGYCTYDYYNFCPFFIIFVIVWLICLSAFVGSYLLKLSLSAFVAFENRRDFSLVGTYRNALFAMAFCTVGSIFAIMCITFMLPLNVGFKFSLTITLAVILPITFLLLTQDDVKPLVRIELTSERMSFVPTNEAFTFNEYDIV